MRPFLMAVSLYGVLFVALALAEDNRKTDKQKAESKFTYLDLQPKANQKLKEDFHTSQFKGNNLEDLPIGEQTFEGIKFKIGNGMIQLGSTMVQDRPEMVQGILVNKSFAKLHILQATGYKAEDDAIVGEYTVTWDDDTSVTIPIVYGKDVLDWWYDDNSPEPSRGKVAWKGDNEPAKERNSRIRLYLTTWENPKPDKKVKTIDFSSTKQTPAAPFCVAMTIEN